MSVEDQPRDLVGLVRNDRVVKKRGEWHVREAHLGGDTFLGGMRSDARQLVARTQGRSLGEERFQVGERKMGASGANRVSHRDPP